MLYWQHPFDKEIYEPAQYIAEQKSYIALYATVSPDLSVDIACDSHTQNRNTGNQALANKSVKAELSCTVVKPVQDKCYS